jgi:hypothetical protein
VSLVQLAKKVLRKNYRQELDAQMRKEATAIQSFLLDICNAPDSIGKLTDMNQAISALMHTDIKTLIDQPSVGAYHGFSRPEPPTTPSLDLLNMQTENPVPVYSF